MEEEESPTPLHIGEASATVHFHDGDDNSHPLSSIMKQGKGDLDIHQYDNWHPHDILTNITIDPENAHRFFFSQQQKVLEEAKSLSSEEEKQTLFDNYNRIASEFHDHYIAIAQSNPNHNNITETGEISYSGLGDDEQKTPTTFCTCGVNHYLIKTELSDKITKAKIESIKQLQDEEALEKDLAGVCISSIN